MRAYFLSRHTFVRETDGHAVFLDLKRNKYIAVDSEELNHLRAGFSEESVAERSGDNTLDQLVDEGVLTRDQQIGKPVVPIEIEPACSMFLSAHGDFPRIKFVDFMRFVRAWLIVTAIFYLMPLRWVVMRVQRRKANGRSGGCAFDVKEAGRLLIAHRMFAPNFYDVRDACLRDSLTYIEFCSYYGIYPTLVFGVKMAPFAAHAWVQEGAAVLNDSLMNVRRFAPILAV